MQMIAAAAYFEIFEPSNECMSLPLRTALTHGAKYEQRYPRRASLAYVLAKGKWMMLAGRFNEPAFNARTFQRGERSISRCGMPSSMYCSEAVANPNDE